MNKRKTIYKKIIAITIVTFLSIQSNASNNGNFNVGPYVGIYSQTMGEETNFGFRSGFEVILKNHYLFIPKIRFNLSNKSEMIFDKKIVLLRIDYDPVIVPRFEFGFDLGYTHKIAKLLSPYLTAGITYGKYQTPHTIIYDEYGIRRGEIWAESRLLGIPISIGNYFEISKGIKIKGNIHSTHYRNVSCTGSSTDYDRNEIMEIHRGISFGGGIDIVYFIRTQEANQE